MSVKQQVSTRTVRNCLRKVLKGEASDFAHLPLTFQPTDSMRNDRRFMEADFRGKVLRVAEYRLNGVKHALDCEELYAASVKLCGELAERIVADMLGESDE